MEIYMKKISKEDQNNIELFEFITSLPEEIGGFRNPWYYSGHEKQFASWLDVIIKIDEGEYKIEGEALRHSIYWIYLGETPVGLGKTRYLTEEEKEFVGHVAYYISPQHRGKGLGTKALKLLVEKTKEDQGIEEVIISIEVENLASRRIAEKCGAELKEIVDNVACKYYL